MQLRDYQQAAIDEIYSNYRRGIKSQLLFAPTGCGKTLISCKILADAYKKGRKVLFLCHRTKLVHQTKETLARLGVPCNLIIPGYKQNTKALVHIATLQTIKNRELPEDVGLVIFDEAHISTYFEVAKTIFDKYSGKLYFLSNCLFLGLTATPWRMHKKEGFCQFYQAIVRTKSPKELINENYLAPARFFTYDSFLDTKKIKSDSSGEFDLKALIAACNEKYDDSIIATFKQLCPERKAIVFCVGVKQVRDLNQKFLDAGFASEIATGKTTEKEREAIYDRLRSGETQIFVNCGVATEGFDEPSIDCVVLARPTRSKALALQMIGRGLRLSENKQNCFILDFGGILSWFADKGEHDPLSIKSAGLCPRWKNTEMLLKTCPFCGEQIPIFARVCPYCFEELPFEEKLKRVKNQEEIPDFIEYLTPEAKEQIIWLRSEIKKQYLENYQPWLAPNLFKVKYGFFPTKEWMLGALFNFKNPEANASIFAHKCAKNNSNANKGLINFWLNIEFGTPGTKYLLLGGKEEYTAPSLSLKNLDSWQQLLGLSEENQPTLKEIKEAYLDKLDKLNPSILNYLFELAKEDLQKQKIKQI